MLGTRWPVHGPELPLHVDPLRQRSQPAARLPGLPQGPILERNGAGKFPFVRNLVHLVRHRLHHPVPGSIRPFRGYRGAVVPRGSHRYVHGPRPLLGEGVLVKNRLHQCRLTPHPNAVRTRPGSRLRPGKIPTVFHARTPQMGRSPGGIVVRGVGFSVRRAPNAGQFVGIWKSHAHPIGGTGAARQHPRRRLQRTGNPSAGSSERRRCTGLVKGQRRAVHLFQLPNHYRCLRFWPHGRSPR